MIYTSVIGVVILMKGNMITQTATYIQIKSDKKTEKPVPRMITRWVQMIMTAHAGHRKTLANNALRSMIYNGLGRYAVQKVAFLMTQGVDLNQKDTEGRTLLMTAAAEQSMAGTRMVQF